MCANKLDPQIITHVGTTEPQNIDALMSKANNMERQLAHEKATQPKREGGKRPIKKEESMATFIKTNSKPPNGKNFNNGKGNQKEGVQQLTLSKR